LTAVSRCRELADAYREAGGAGPVVLIRRVSPGDPTHTRHEDQLRTYRSYAPSPATAHWSQDLPASGEAGAITEALVADADAVGADCLNLRVHSPDLAPTEARAHIEALGEVVTLLASSWRPTLG
jgi:hypothetical protein